MAPHPSPRAEKLRRELIKAIPRVPSDRRALEHMKQKPLSEVLVHFIHWRSRYVGARPRKVEIEPNAVSDARWTSMAAGIEGFLGKVNRGDDLTPHLSLEPHTRGYALAAHTPGATAEDRWSDKDLLLVRTKYHHFHLGVDVEAGGHVARTNDLLFAKVSRETLRVIAIFDHTVFELGSLENERLSALHSEIIFRGLSPGTGVFSPGVMSSGHSDHVVFYAQRCSRLINWVDPKLDERAYIEELFAQVRSGPPKRPKFLWGFQHLDLAVVDRVTKTAFVLQQGWN